VLLPKARAVLDAARDAGDAVDEVNRGVRGALRIGTLNSLGHIDLPVLLGQFHRDYPAVSVLLSTAGGGSPGLIGALTEGKLDLAFVSIPGDPPTGARLRELTSTPLDLVLPVSHRLAGHAEVAVAELDGEAFVDFPHGYGNRAVTDRAFAIAGLQRQVAIEITAFADGADFVRQGMGIALLPRGIAPPDDALATRPVTGVDLSWPISLATPLGRAPGAAARAFESLLDRYLHAASSRDKQC
jgi:DNA-binding transcriptional LysR family regulator